MSTWEELPEWLRWILCWPIIIICGLLTGIIGDYFVGVTLTRMWMPADFSAMISPIIAGLLTVPFLFISIQLFVPRKQHYLVGLWCAVNVVTFLLCVVRLHFEYQNNSDEIWLTIRDIVWALINVPVGLYFYFWMRDEV